MALTYLLPLVHVLVYIKQHLYGNTEVPLKIFLHAVESYGKQNIMDLIYSIDWMHTRCGNFFFCVNLSYKLSLQLQLLLLLVSYERMKRPNLLVIYCSLFV